MRKLGRIGIPCAAAAVLVVGISAPAQAYSTGCSVTGASGSFTGTSQDPNLIDPLKLYVKDTKSDGHHPAIRLVTFNLQGDMNYWSWHHSYKESPGSTTWNTRAETTSASKAMFGALVQVANFEGSTLLRSCNANAVNFN